jgi:hypothetical protein
MTSSVQWRLSERVKPVSGCLARRGRFAPNRPSLAAHSSLPAPSQHFTPFTLRPGSRCGTRQTLHGATCGRPRPSPTGPCTSAAMTACSTCWTRSPASFSGTSAAPNPSDPRLSQTAWCAYFKAHQQRVQYIAPGLVSTNY